MKEKTLRYLTTKINETLYNSVGGSKYGSFNRHLSGITTRSNILDPAISNNGFVFFGRPKLNLFSSSIKQDRILASLNTLNAHSLAFAIRCYLDPIFAERTDIIKLASTCPLYNKELPFIPMLTNSLASLTGWPEPSMEVHTSEGGFFSENMTMAKGHDDLNKTLSLTAEFYESQGFPIVSLFMLWFRWIHLSLRGVVIPHGKYVEEYKISYSLPIYRFRLDTSGQFILFWAKGTGCFPTGYPMADYMNYTYSEVIKHHDKCSIPFTVNFPEYMDIAILLDFNLWIKQTCPQIDSYRKLSLEEKSYLIHKAVPYIEFKDGTRELQWRISPEIDRTSPEEQLENIFDDIETLLT